MAGLTAAGVLQARGWSVVLLDKGRSAGGRLATRRISESIFDHGAQFFTVRSERFRQAVSEWEEAQVVRPWFVESGHTRYCAAGGMNSLAKHLARVCDVRTLTRVSGIERDGAQWLVSTDFGGIFRTDAILLTAPAQQTLALLSPCVDQLPPEILAALKRIAFEPCFALMVLLNGRSQVPAPGYVRPDAGPVEWLADNTQKGISSGTAALTIHARADFTSKYLEASPAEVTRLLTGAASTYWEGPVLAAQLHRWMFSKPLAVDEQPCLFSRMPGLLAIAGDAFGAPRVEGAFLSGLAAAEKIAGA